MNATKRTPLMTCLTLLAATAMMLGADEADERPRLNVGGVAVSDGTGVIKVTVAFNGKKRKGKPIRLSADPFCARAHTEKVRSEKYVFGEGDALQNVLVYISSDIKGDAPARPHRIDQHGCIYLPHVSAIVAGQKVYIQNSDKTLHNVKYSSKENGSFNQGMPKGSSPLEKTFDKTEFATSFKCNVHTWMSAYLHVMPHPFFAVTQNAGTVEITGVPAGDHKVTVWHEFDKFKPDAEAKSVQVEAGKTAELTFTYSPPKKKE